MMAANLRDLLDPPAAPTRKGKVVTLLKRDLDAEKRKATLEKYEADQAEQRALHKSARMKALNADPDFKAKLRQTASARMKALHADPDFKARRSKRKAARIERDIERLKDWNAKRIDASTEAMCCPRISA